MVKITNYVKSFVGLAQLIYKFFVNMVLKKTKMQKNIKFC